MGSGNHESCIKSEPSGEGETSLRDGSTAIDDRSENAHVAERVKSPPLETELVPGSHGKSNSSVVEVIILWTQ